MKTIIAGTDFSESSVNACKYAAFLADKLNCKLTIFNLFDAPLIHSNVGLYGITYTAQRTTSVYKTNKLIMTLQELYPKLKIGSFVITGSFKEELKRFASAHQIQAAVMGLEAKSRISKFIYGSHGVNLAGKLSCPVIIVPSSYKIYSFSSLTLAVDNNEKLHKSSLKSVEEFVKKAKSKVELLHIRTEDELFHPVVTTIKFNGKKHDIKVIKAKDIQAGLKRYTSAEKPDMITVISKRHSAFYNFFNESVTKRIAFIAKVPVMAIHE